MLVAVSRTSCFEGQPCEEAKLLPCVRQDRRNVDAPEKLMFHGGTSDWWYSAGRNHRVENGMIVRDFDAEGWFIEINSMDELLSFVNRHGGRAVIQSSWMGDNIWQVEIYDDYRE